MPLFFVKIQGQDESFPLRFCRWSEDIEYQGETFVAGDFDFEVTNANNEMPTAKLSGFDGTGHVHRLLEQAHGGTGSEVDIIIVNTASLDKKPEFVETFMVSSSSVKDGAVEFALSMPNYASMRFPRRIIMSGYCSWIFRSKECAYTGDLTTCDYSLRGANGCTAHRNSANFGGFPSVG